MRMSFSRRVPVAELLGHPVYEHSQAPRQLPRMGIEDVDRRRRRWKAGEHFDQRAAGQLRVDGYRGTWISPRPRHAQATLVSGPVTVTIAGNFTWRALPPAPKTSGTMSPLSGDSNPTIS